MNESQIVGYPVNRPGSIANVGYVASEGGALFVARRAMNLHGCAPAFRAPFPPIPAFKSSCAASEGRASFVARRAVNLHGCALPHSALPPAAAPPDPPVVPPVSPTAGVLQGAYSVREWGMRLPCCLSDTIPYL